jgi:ribonuclease HII
VIKYVIGIDEAGRGPLAGPVSLAVVAWEARRDRELKQWFVGVKDCKQLSEKQREEWRAKLKSAEREGLVKIAASFASNAVIDEWGIMLAIRLALARALRRLALPPAQCRVLLDGSLRAPRQYQDQETLIKGDEREPIIALASIVAKVRRDRLMTRLAREYPGYGFELHKGYGTRAHYAAIKKIGRSPLHRQTFLTNLG